MSEARGGLPRRQQRVLQRVRPGLRARRQQMRRDPRGRSRPRLQRPGDGQVDRGPGRAVQPGEDGLAVQVVGEGRRCGARDDTGPTGLVEQGRHRGLLAGCDAVYQEADVYVAAGHGRPLQQPDAFRGQPGQPAPQRLRDAGRDLGGLVPRALGGQQPGQLPDEERVAAAALPQPGGDLGRKARPGQFPGQRPNVVRREAGEDELLGLACDLAQQSGRLGVAVRAQQQHGSRRQGAGQEPQQPQRRLVGPVQVVQDDEHGPPRGQAAQAPRHRLEQAELGVGRRGGARRLRRGRPRRLRRAGAGLQQPARLAELGRRQAAGPQHL